MLVNVFETIMSGCACVIVLCVTIGAVMITVAFVKSVMDNENNKY
jgi:hypothetical protein